MENEKQGIELDLVVGTRPGAPGFCDRECKYFSKLHIHEYVSPLGGFILRRWFLNGRLHRDDGPAIIRYHQNKEIYADWYKEGRLYLPTAHEKMLWEISKKNKCLTETTRDNE